MILPVMAFFLMVLVFGGIASLACIIDTRAAHRAVVPFMMFFAGLGVYLSVFALGLLGPHVSPALGDSLAFFIGPVVGAIGGGLVGYVLGVKRRRRHSSN
jgi:hypothetical protein